MDTDLSLSDQPNWDFKRFFFLKFLYQVCSLVFKDSEIKCTSFSQILLNVDINPTAVAEVSQFSQFDEKVSHVVLYLFIKN